MLAPVSDRPGRAGRGATCANRPLQPGRWLLAAMFALPLLASAREPISYAYDDAGRLIQATDPEQGFAILYEYDAVGNILRRRTQTLDSLDISGFSPALGRPGEAFVVHGSGFGEAPEGLELRVGGVVLLLQSVSPTRLTAELPSDAISGPVEVRRNGQVVRGPYDFRAMP